MKSWVGNKGEGRQGGTCIVERRDEMRLEQHGVV